MATWNLPTARRVNQSDTLFGKVIHDPYRWLEDPDAPETQKFVQDQNAVVKSFLATSQIRDKFEQKMTQLMDYEKFGCPMKRGDSYYYFHNSGLQPQSILYKQKTLDSKGETFLNPNELSEDGTTSISAYAFSESGKYCAYSLSESGSDWVKIHVRETKDGAPLDLESTPITWAKFTGIEWTHDDKGFFYNRYPAPAVDSDKAGTETGSNKNATIYYHQLMAFQAEDVPIYSIPESPDHMPHAEVSEDGDYLLITVSESCDPKNKVYICDLKSHLAEFGKVQKNPTFKPIVDVFEAKYD
jgi:prolyl oligopeptidase